MHRAASRIERSCSAGRATNKPIHPTRYMRLARVRHGVDNTHTKTRRQHDKMRPECIDCAVLLCKCKLGLVGLFARHASQAHKVHDDCIAHIRYAAVAIAFFARVRRELFASPRGTLNANKLYVHLTQIARVCVYVRQGTKAGDRGVHLVG